LTIPRVLKSLFCFTNFPALGKVSRFHFRGKKEDEEIPSIKCSVTAENLLPHSELPNTSDFFRLGLLVAKSWETKTKFLRASFPEMKS
jgi:hypothetical protein